MFRYNGLIVTLLFHFLAHSMENNYSKDQGLFSLQLEYIVSLCVAAGNIELAEIYKQHYAAIKIEDDRETLSLYKRIHPMWAEY